MISLMALTGLILSTVGVASADQFATANTAPTVGTPTLSGTISPDAGASDTVYSYSIVVGDAESLNDLDTVTLCLYLDLEDSTCATPDPTTDVKLTWTQATNTFAIDDGSDNDFWALSTPTSPTLTGISGTFTFNFTVSEATREGTWHALVTATDSSAGTASDGTATSTVNHYAAITARGSQEFGTVAAGQAGVELMASPTVTSNGQTTYSMTAGDFTDGTYTFTLNTGADASVAPSAGQVAFDCHVGTTFAQASAKRVGSTSTQLSAVETATGTPEAGSVLANSCRLAHGGEKPVSTYTAEVINAIGNG